MKNWKSGKVEIEDYAKIRNRGQTDKCPEKRGESVTAQFLQ